VTRIEVPNVPTTTPADRDTATCAARTASGRPRRRPRLVPDSTSVRLKEHAAQDRCLLDVVARWTAAA
jgi:hypothetical protein